MKRFTILRQVPYRMTIILFTVIAGKTCSAVSPLPEYFMLILGEILLQVTHGMLRSCGKFYTTMALRAVLYITALLKEPWTW